MKYLILFTTMLFAAELEVDGNLKVTGTVDASGNPITNVGAALSMTDAINGNVLQSALRDDGVYEYKYYNIMWVNSVEQNGTNQYPFSNKYREMHSPQGWDNSPNDWTDKINQLSSEGWMINRVINHGTGYNIFSVYELKRPISDD